MQGPLDFAPCGQLEALTPALLPGQGARLRLPLLPLVRGPAVRLPQVLLLMPPGVHSTRREPPALLDAVQGPFTVAVL